MTLRTSALSMLVLSEFIVPLTLVLAPQYLVGAVMGFLATFAVFCLLHTFGDIDAE